MKTKVFLLCVGVSLTTLFLHGIINDKNQPTTGRVSIESKKGVVDVAFIGYTYKCPSCNNDKAEGYYSFVDDYCYENCKVCNDYREIGGNDDDK